MNPTSVADLNHVIAAIFDMVVAKGETTHVNDPKRVDYLRVSSFPFCPRAWYLNFQAAKSRSRHNPLPSDYFTSVGTLVHRIFQSGITSVSMPAQLQPDPDNPTVLPYGGLLIQDWHCTHCGKNHEFQPRPLHCQWCGTSSFRDDEHEVTYGTHVLGHMDGTLAFPVTKGQPYSKKWAHIPIDYKGLALDTPLPTPNGWTTMGKVEVGDLLFDSEGNPCRVVSKSSIHKRRCYRITFDDGSSVVCDDEHLWTTTRKGKSSVVNTEEIKATLDERHVIALSGALKCKKRSLPIHPYVLGCWLGDGTAANGIISKPDTELFDNIEACGYATHQPEHSKRGTGCPHRVVEGLNSALRIAGLKNNKHIPNDYLRAGYSQRVALLQGLMDTDGSYNSLRQQAVFSTTDASLAEKVKELICSLGQRGVCIPITAHGFGKTVQAYHVRFRPVNGFQPFRLTRKAKLVVPRGNEIRSTQRKIVSVEKVPAVKTQCIAVDSPDKTYLCTTWMIPTHNTCTTSALKGGKLPYPENKDQLLSYAAIKAHDGYYVPAVALIYLPRDNPFNGKVISMLTDNAAQEKRIQRYEKAYAKAQTVLTVEEAMELPVRATTDFDYNCQYCKFKRACADQEKGSTVYLERLMARAVQHRITWLKRTKGQVDV